MKKTILFIVSILFFSNIFSQTSWKYEYYKTINHKNYKTYTMFNSKFDFSKPDIPLLNATLLFMTNEIRVEKKLLPLEYAQELEIMAYQHAKRMSDKNFFSHEDNTSKSRKTTSDRANLAGIENPYIAENIAYSSFDEGKSYYEIAKILIDMWMNSKGHRENILSEKALQGACGVFINGDLIYGVQNYQWFYKIVQSSGTDELPLEK